MGITAVIDYEKVIYLNGYGYLYDSLWRRV